MKNKKEFDYNFADLGDYLTVGWTAKSLKFEKYHFKELSEDLRLENLTKQGLEINIEQHEILKHPKKVKLGPYEIKHIKIKIPCKMITGKHKSFLILKSKNQTEKALIKITHLKD